MQTGSGSTPVIGLDRPLVDALADAADRDGSLQLVTSADTRLSLAARLALTEDAARWVVETPGDGYYDGLSGVRLRHTTDGFEPVLPEGFDPAGDLDHVLARQYTETDPADARQVWVGVELRHDVAPAGYGGVAEAVCVALTGAGPAGWGPVEPATEPWDPDALGEYVAGRAPDPTRLVISGAGAGVAGTLTVSAGSESLVLAVAPANGLPSEQTLVDLADTLRQDHPLWMMTALSRSGRVDLTYPARREGPSDPLGLAVGPAYLSRAGLDHAPLLADPPGRRLGGDARPAVWYGTTGPGAWDTLARVLEHLDS